MKHNIIAMGERTVSGKYGRIHCAGELHADGLEADRINVAGEFNCKGSTVKVLRAAGELDADSCSFGDISVAGEANMRGICKADKAKIYGELNADGFTARIVAYKLKRKSIHGSAHPTWSGTICAETFENFGEHALHYNYEYKNIVSTDTLTADGEITCETFYSIGDVCAPSINAETIFMLPHSSSKINSLTGTDITVKTRFFPSGAFRKIPLIKRVKPCSCAGTLKLSSVEGDTVYLENVEADSVSGAKIVIGAGCKIGRIEYTRSVKIDKNSSVGEASRL